MDENKLKICRLCLNMINDENYEILEEIHAEMLETILTDNLKQQFVSSDPIICCNCTNSLQKCYDFKTICLIKEDRVKASINVNELLKVNLEEVKELFEDGEMHKGQKMCRLCFSLDSHYYANMSDDFGDGPIQNMLMRCIPEINLELTNEPLVCQACLYLLKKQLTFIQNCLEVEEKMNLFREQRNKSIYDIVDLDDYLFFKKLKMENDSDGSIQILVMEPTNTITSIQKYVDTCNRPSEAVFIKTEPQCEILPPEAVFVKTGPDCEIPPAEAVFIKTEPDCEIPPPEAVVIKAEPDCEIRDNEELDISENVEMKVERNIGENAESNREEENRTLRNQNQEQSNTSNKQRTSTVKKFTCSQCSYITKNRGNFQRHHMTHRSPSEIKMFQCNICGHKSKRKDHLKEHLILHRDASQVQMFKCTICPYETKVKANLRRHMNRNVHSQNSLHPPKPIVQKRKVYKLVYNCPGLGPVFKCTDEDGK